MRYQGLIIRPDEVEAEEWVFVFQLGGREAVQGCGLASARAIPLEVAEDFVEDV